MSIDVINEAGTTGQSVLGGPAVGNRSRFVTAAKSLNLSARIGLTIMLVLWLAFFIGALFTKGPSAIDTNALLKAPGAGHLLGTDQLGRDQLARLLYGGRASVEVALAAVALASVIGVPLGIYAGFYPKGITRRFIDLIGDAGLALPGLVLALTLAAALGPSLRNVVIAIAIVYTPEFMRIARSQTALVREMMYLDAGRAAGANGLYLMRRYVLPNVAGPVIAYVFLAFSAATLAEAALSFLGVGLQPPAPSLGQMIHDGVGYLNSAPWMVLAPGIAVSLLVIGYNLIGDGLQASRDRSSEIFGR